MDERTGKEDVGEGTLAEADRFRRLEYPGDDFPFYNGRPERLSVGKWLLVLAGVAAAHTLLEPACARPLALDAARNTR